MNTICVEKAYFALSNVCSKKLESSLGAEISPIFKIYLKNYILLIRTNGASNEKNGFVNKTIFELNTQAGHILTFILMNKYCDFIHSADTDFVAIVGPNCVIKKNNGLHSKQRIKTI